MNPITLSALVLLTAFAAKGVKAQDLPVPYNHVEYKQSGNSFTWNPLTGKTPSSGAGVVFRGPTGISNAEPKISTMARLPFDKRGDVPASQMAKVTSPFTKQAFAKTLTLAGRVAWPIGVIISAGEIYQYLKEDGFEDIKNTPQGITARKPVNGQHSGWEYKTTGAHTTWSPTPDAAMQLQIGIWASLNPTSVYVFKSCSFSQSNSDWTCKYDARPDWNPKFTEQTHAVGRRATTSNDATMKDFDQQQLEDAIAQKSGWPTSAARALQSALNTPGVTIQTEPPTVSGPSSIPGTTTSTTTQTSVSPGTTKEVASGTPGAQPATKTTTSTTTNNATYNNNNVTHNTKTTTTTNITNNITNKTETTTDKEETKEEQDKEDESPPTDTDLTKVPELYERKYPDGMVGIWNTKSEEIKQSPLFTLADDLMPTGISGGSCPSWSLDLSFGGSFGDYGSQDVSPPCWIWDVARLIIIASALILARALVFGG